MGDLFDWAKTANAISVGQVPDWMLEGYRTKPQGQGEPRRHQIMGGPAFESKGTYHKDGQPLAFADVFEQPDRVNIGYMSTAPEHRGQGHGSALMQHVYDSYPDKKIVWGDRFHDAADAMYNKYKTNPRTAATPDLAQNWVFLNDNIATGVQPHHLLVHRVEGAGGLDGDPILGQLGNTWVAGNGIPQGLEHDVARGTFDKKGRPQIWESNIDRNYVIDKLMEHRQAHPRMAQNSQDWHPRIRKLRQNQLADDEQQRQVDDILRPKQPSKEKEDKYCPTCRGRGGHCHTCGGTGWNPKMAARAEQNTYALLSRKSQGDDAPWNIDSTHATEDEAHAARTDENQRVVMFPRGEEIHPLGYYQRLAARGDIVPMPPESGDVYEKMVCSQCGSDDLRNSVCHDCGSADQYDTYVVYINGNPAAKNNYDGTMTMLSYGVNKTVEEMYAEIQGAGWEVKSEGPKGDHYAVTIQSPQGGQNVRTGDSRELAYTAALTWVWQHSHFSSETRVAMADRSGIPEVDSLIEEFLKMPQGDWTTDDDTYETLRDPQNSHGACQSVTEHFVEFAKSKGFQAYSTDTDLEEMGYKPSIEPFGEMGFDENDEMTYGFYPEHTIATIVLPGTGYGREIYIDFTASQYGYTDHPKVTSKSKEIMDLPINSKKTLGQVFASLRPSPADGNHLGIQAHTLGYTKAELETFLESQEDAGTPRGWKSFKEAAYVAYASRGWKVEANFELQLYEAPNEDGQTGGMVKQEIQNDGVEQAKQNALQQLQNHIIYRATLIDPMTGRTVWDTDDEWRNQNQPDANKWQQGQIIPVEQDWAFSTRPAA